jgi:transposase
VPRHFADQRSLRTILIDESGTNSQTPKEVFSRTCRHIPRRARPPSLQFISLIERCYDAILTERFAFHDAQPALISSARKRLGRKPRRVAHYLLRRLSTRKADVLRFLSDPAVPFTNNLAERDCRMMKLRQKISGGFRSMEGTEDFSVIRSLISTARKQRWDILQAQRPANHVN